MIDAVFGHVQQVFTFEALRGSNAELLASLSNIRVLTDDGNTLRTITPVSINTDKEHRIIMLFSFDFDSRSKKSISYRLMFQVNGNGERRPFDDCWRIDPTSDRSTSGSMTTPQKSKISQIHGAMSP